MGNGGYHILVIEDEKPIQRFLRASLEDAGYCVSEATTAAEGLRIAMRQPPDVVILDLGLPDQDGQDLLMRLREWFYSPILVLSARDQEEQKVKALDLGADDYLTKPFGVSELLARLRVAIRHAFRIGKDESKLRVGELEIDLANRAIRLGIEPIPVLSG